MTIESDASKLGWGAHCQDIQTGGPWTREEARYHINTLELKAAFLALQTFGGQLTHSHILLLMDNRTVIAFINYCTVYVSCIDYVLHCFLVWP